MSTAADGDEFDFHSGVVPPDDVLDASTVSGVGLVRCRRTGDVVEAGKILA
jgi:hypothetical protein